MAQYSQALFPLPFLKYGGELLACTLVPHCLSRVLFNTVCQAFLLSPQPAPEYVLGFRWVGRARAGMCCISMPLPREDDSLWGAEPFPCLAPEMPVIFTKEEGHSCFKSCWVKCRILAGRRWLWRGRGRVGWRRQLWGWVCARLGFCRAAAGEGSRDDAVALRLFPRPTQHFNRSGPSASCKQDRGPQRLFAGLQSELPQAGASTAEIAPAALKLAAEQRGTHCLPECDGQGLLAPPMRVRGCVLTSFPLSPPPFGSVVRLGPAWACFPRTADATQLSRMS